MEPGSSGEAKSVIFVDLRLFSGIRRLPAQRSDFLLADGRSRRGGGRGWSAVAARGATWVFALASAGALAAALEKPRPGGWPALEAGCCAGGFNAL